VVTAPVSIEPENYEETLNCVINSDNPSCWAAPSIVPTFTYNQSTDTTNTSPYWYGFLVYYDLIVDGSPKTVGVTFGPFLDVPEDVAPKFKITNYKSFYIEKNSDVVMSADTQYLGFKVNPPQVLALVELAYTDVLANFKLQIFPTENTETSVEVVTSTDNTVLTVNYDFAADRAQPLQYYLVVYAVSSLNEYVPQVFANQYPMYMRYTANGTPYAIVDVNNFLINKTITYTLYFYITDKISDLETLYSSGTISSDENCISYPRNVTLLNLAYTAVTQGADYAAEKSNINCVLDSGLSNCYELLEMPSVVNMDVPVASDDGFTFGDLIFTENKDATVASLLAGGTSESTQTLRVYNTSPGYCVSEIKGTGVTLQNTSTSPINVLMTLEINPAGSGATLCDSSEDITVAESISWTGNSGIIYYLVAFTTDGLYANQFPLYFDTYNDGTADVGSAYADVCNLVLPTGTGNTTDLYFCVTDSVLDFGDSDAPAYKQDDDGSWTIVPSGTFYSPFQIFFKNISYTLA